MVTVSVVKALALAVALAGAAEEPAMPRPELKSLKPPVLLPDGREFKTWEPVLRFTKTYYVDGSSAAASDENAGTKARPFKTIQRAAEVLRQGERVVIAEGVYREWVRPRRGGSGPSAMISYQAAPGAKAVIKGSRVVTDRWEPSGATAGLWKLTLGPKYFEDGYNPFTLPNITPEQFDGMSWAQRWRGKKPYILPRGLAFQDGRRLRQVNTRDALKKEAGTYWVNTAGPVLYVRLFADGDPNAATMEITTQRCVFAPEKMGLGYIHVQGLTIEHAGNEFPMPQYGALSTWRGNHWVVEDCTVRQANGVGIDLGYQYWALPQPKTRHGWHIVRRNTVTDCGVCGIQGLACRDTLIEDNLLVRNAFHPVERYYETGGIKTHGNANTLIRRNRIFETFHGCGIWMDFANVNSRCTQNIIAGSSTIHGGIFIEASQEPNLIDRNVIWGTRGAGIYEHDCFGQVFAHNFIGKSTGPALRLRGKVTNRKVRGKPIRSGGHTVVNNVLFANAQMIETKHEHRDVSGNLSEGIVAAFDRETLTLTWHATGDAPPCTALKPMTHDFFGRALTGKTLVPGPFRGVPRESMAVQLWPVK